MTYRDYLTRLSAWHWLTNFGKRGSYSLLDLREYSLKVEKIQDRQRLDGKRTSRQRLRN